MGWETTNFEDEVVGGCFVGSQRTPIVTSPIFIADLFVLGVFSSQSLSHFLGSFSLNPHRSTIFIAELLVFLFLTWVRPPFFAAPKKRTARAAAASKALQSYDAAATGTS